jgi:methyltransferase-like protein
MLEMSDKFIFRVSGRFVLHELNEEMYWLFDNEEGDVFRLNEVSYFLISCFDGKTPLSKIVSKVLEKYSEAKPDEVKTDVKCIVEKLVKEKVVEIIRR